MSFKLEGTFTIRDGDKILRVAKNNLLYSGARAILMYLGNLHAAVYTNGVQPVRIHYGDSDDALDPFYYRLRSWQGQISITGVTMNPGAAAITDPAFWNHIRFTGSLAAGTVTLIRELALAVTTTNPTSNVDYPNVVIARAVVSPSYLKEAGAPKTVDYDLRIVPA